ncbi:MAG: YoaK family protein [Mucilaginibacter sp.]|uniref:YoaK family protein n=1 Tax=Mucilaginibacter sp. TaxID=1882438 RepID=UPI0034E46360
METHNKVETSSKEQAALLTAKTQERLIICLAMIAGFIDAYGFFHFKTYLSFMSGNTTQTGFSLGQARFANALISFVAILFFVIGVFTGSVLSKFNWYKSRWAPFTVVASVLAFYGIASFFFTINNYCSVGILSFSMGYMNTILSHIGKQSVNPDFVTGTLNNIAQHFASIIKDTPLPDSQGTWDSHQRRAIVLLVIWFSFLAGALFCIIATSWFGKWNLAFPVALLLISPLLSSGKVR